MNEKCLTEQFDNVIELYKQGYSYKKISREIKTIGETTAFNYVKAYLDSLEENDDK